MATGHHAEFLKAQNFICWEGLEDRGRSPCQILSILVLYSGDITIFRIFKMATAVILNIWNQYILLAAMVQRADMHHHSKFREKLSILAEILRFLKKNFYARKHFFSERIIKVWNSLPPSIVGFKSLSIFGSSLNNVSFGIYTKYTVSQKRQWCSTL